MKIAIVCYPTYGGSGVVATELGRFLAQRGHEVHFISSSMPFRLQHSPETNITFHEVPTMNYDVLNGNLYGIALASKIIQVVKDYHLEIVHVHYAVPHAISAFLARSALGKNEYPFKVVTTLHGTDITLTGRAPSFFPIVTYAINGSDAVTSVSQWLKDETIREFDIKRPIDVISNFVDVQQFRRGLNPCKRSYFAPNGESVLLHISNFRPVKRIPDVIEVFNRVQKKQPAVLVMVGDGPEKEAAAEQARRLGLLNKIRFLGKQDDIEYFMSCADVFLFPSEYESFGLAALEAMSCELPVVASNGGGLKEVIHHGETGLLANVGDVEAMTDHALTLLNDTALARKIGRQARESVLQQYVPELIIPQYEALYQRVLTETSLVAPMEFNIVDPNLAYAEGI
ncbi:MAG: N-acetyl-alpha-D-glucosaminyl L-malate synthase BshA [Candidatus Sumerlaeia bacterium]|nr:N-acetyl-alpha-D-glucosaminyl L-malate synthase BshA [Candidatus Sumerlaeia bacterium]